MAAQRDPQTGKIGAASWRIARRAINQHGDHVYDVFHGADRRAWGLKDEATARRWLRRLSGGSDDTGGGEAAEESDDETFVPPRVWWNEG